MRVISLVLLKTAEQDWILTHHHGAEEILQINSKKTTMVRKRQYPTMIQALTDTHSWQTWCAAPGIKSITQNSFTMPNAVKPIVAIKTEAGFCINSKLVPWESKMHFWIAVAKKPNNHILWQADLAGTWTYTSSYFSNWIYKPHSPHHTLPWKTLHGSDALSRESHMHAAYLSVVS